MSEQHEQLVDLLREVHRDLSRYFKVVLDAFSITPPVILICNQIRINPGITLSEAARRSGIAKSHVSKIVRDLEQRGWVIRDADIQDQRLACLHLNDRGYEQLQQIRIQIRSRLNELVADIPDERAAALVKGLSDIKTTLQQGCGNGCQASAGSSASHGGAQCAAPPAGDPKEKV